MQTARRALIRIFLALLVLLVLGRALLATPPGQSWIGNRLEAFVGPALIVGRVRPSFYPVLGLRVDEIHLVDPTQPGSRSAATVAEVRLAIDLGLLMEGELVIESLLVSDATIRVEPGEHGESTMAGAIASIAAAFASDPAELELEAKATAATLEDGANPFVLPITLRNYTTELGRAGSEPLIVGLKEVDAVIVFGAPPGTISFEVELRPGDRGRINARGLYGAGGADDGIDFELAVSDVPADELLSESLGGFSMYSAGLNVAGTLGSAVVPPNLAGGGRIDFRGGDLGSSNLARLIFDAMLSIMPKGGAHDDKPAAHPAKIDYLRADLKIADGVVAISKLDFVTDDFTVTGSGGISFDLEVLLDLEVALTTSGVARLLTSAQLPIPRKIGGLPPTPIRIKGEGGKLTGRPMVTKLPLATAGYVVGGAVNASTGLFQRTLSIFGGGGDSESETEQDEAEGAEKAEKAED
jgi:hypothetical protein